MADDGAWPAGWIGIDLEPEYTPGADAPRSSGAMAEVAADGRRAASSSTAATRDDHAARHQRRHARRDPQLARDTGASVHVEHLISTGGTFTMAESLATLAAARAEGIDVTACMYPYDFWATYLGSARFDDGLAGALPHLLRRPRRRRHRRAPHRGHLRGATRPTTSSSPPWPSPRPTCVAGAAEPAS